MNKGNEYTEPNGKIYRFVKRMIAPYKLNLNKFTHVLLVCMKDAEFYTKRNELDDNFESVYQAIFWSVILISGIFFFSVCGMILWYSRKIIRSIQKIHQFIRELNLHAHMPGMTKYVRSKPVLDIVEKNMPKLHYACKEKKRALKELELKYSGFEWENNRPKDVTLYNNWKKIVYPINKFKKDTVNWNGALDKLKAIS